jgi:hypothetical protein
MFTRIIAGLALHAALLFVPVVADDGHNHGAAPMAAAGSALPRFSATSDLFELVGVVNGKQLTVYLDRFADNAPVKGARIDLQVDGASVALEEHGEGEFEGALAQALKPGMTPVTATVAAGSEIDILVGELDVHEEEHAGAAAAIHWRRYVGWAAAATVLLAALLWLRRRSRRAQLGGAA